MKFHPSVWLAAAFLYVICPLDFDFIPAIGFVDDVFVAVTGIRKFSAGMQSRRNAAATATDLVQRMSARTRAGSQAAASTKRVLN
jgi:uncharacterized membrane protein YkvA (DUF1232 family)